MADGFLGRWSRRKQDAAAGKPLEDPAPPARAVVPEPASVQGNPPEAALPMQAARPAPAPAPEPAPPTLAEAQALTPESDFKPFVGRNVAPEVRNMAFKKLFADPHFNVMDGLDIYIGDYSQPDPLPGGMLQQMASAHFLGFFEQDQAADSPPASVAPPGASAPLGSDAGAGAAEIAHPAGQPRDDAEAQSAQAVAQSDVCTAFPKPEAALDAVSPPSGGPASPAIPHAHDHADLRLQPDDAPQRPGVG